MTHELENESNMKKKTNLKAKYNNNRISWINLY